MRLCVLAAGVDEAGSAWKCKLPGARFRLWAEAHGEGRLRAGGREAGTLANPGPGLWEE